jgi:hypothetical protein
MADVHFKGIILSGCEPSECLSYVLCAGPTCYIVSFTLTLITEAYIQLNKPFEAEAHLNNL